MVINGEVELVEGIDKMTREEHIEAHKELHRNLDMLVADLIKHTDKLPSTTSVFDLMKWAYEQTIDPTEEGG